MAGFHNGWLSLFDWFIKTIDSPYMKTILIDLSNLLTHQTWIPFWEWTVRLFCTAYPAGFFALFCFSFCSALVVSCLRPRAQTLKNSGSFYSWLFNSQGAGVAFFTFAVAYLCFLLLWRCFFTFAVAFSSFGAWYRSFLRPKRRKCHSNYFYFVCQGGWGSRRFFLWISNTAFISRIHPSNMPDLYRLTNTIATIGPKIIPHKPPARKPT